jgi:spore coat protein CotF
MYNGAFTPAPSRIMTVAGNNGMPNIGNQQPTVRAIYDSVISDYIHLL